MKKRRLSKQSVGTYGWMGSPGCDCHCCRSPQTVQRGCCWSLPQSRCPPGEAWKEGKRSWKLSGVQEMSEIMKLSAYVSVATVLRYWWMLSMAASSRVWMFCRHCSLASRPRRPSASSSRSSSSDSWDREGGGGGIDDTNGEEVNTEVTNATVPPAIVGGEKVDIVPSYWRGEVEAWAATGCWGKEGGGRKGSRGWWSLEERQRKSRQTSWADWFLKKRRNKTVVCYLVINEWASLWSFLFTLSHFFLFHTKWNRLVEKLLDGILDSTTLTSKSKTTLTSRLRCLCAALRSISSSRSCSRCCRRRHCRERTPEGEDARRKPR